LPIPKKSLSEDDPSAMIGVMGKKKTLTCSQHQVLAARVKAARELLMEIHLTVGRALGVSSKASKVAHKILTKFDDELKDELSNAAARDCPEIDSLDLYYGPTRKNKVVHHARNPK
jgi:hypothetical protein